MSIFQVFPETPEQTNIAPAPAPPIDEWFGVVLPLFFWRIVSLWPKALATPTVEEGEKFKMSDTLVVRLADMPNENRLEIMVAWLWSTSVC